MSIRGMLTPSDLVTAIDDGAIDTVLVAFPDLQGRLVSLVHRPALVMETTHRLLRLAQHIRKRAVGRGSGRAAH